MTNSFYKIRPLRLGTILRKKDNMSYKCGNQGIVSFPLISFYLEGDSHKIIVDTGGTAPDGVNWQPYYREENESLENALKIAGVRPEEIDIVLLTHLHWDHASNNQLFKNARFIVQKRELDFLKAPEPKEKKGFIPELVLRTEYETVEGDCEIVDGISVILAPGHTVGMQCVEVETKSGKYILGGDLITLFENWEHTPHIPNGGFYDLNVITESLEKIDKHHGIVLPGHDEKVFLLSVYQ